MSTRTLAATGLVLCLALTAAGYAAETELRSLSLPVLEARNLDTSDSALRLQYAYAQAGDEPLWMEAERASVLRFQAGRGEWRRDPGASGGAAIAHVEHLEFHFEIRRAGSYTAWYRGFFPFAGTWLHAENMNGGPTQIVTDSRGEVLNQWIWTRGPTYELSAGRHSWNFTPTAWLGGAGLDQVLLTPDPDFVPEGLGGPALASTAPAEGEAITQELTRRDLVQWGRLRWQNLSGAGTVSADWSADRGRTWQALPAGESLAAAPTDRPLQFRLRLQAGPEGGTPYLTGLSASYLAEKLPPLLLENRYLQLRFEGQSGALIGLRNKTTTTEYMVAGQETPLFSFVGVRPEFHTTVEIGFDQAELREVRRPGREELLFSHTLMGGRLETEVRVRLEGRLVRFSMNVRNRTLYDLAQVRFLKFRGLRIGEDPSDDYLCTPPVTGAIVKYPASLRYPRLTYTDRPLGYPGMASMCWMNLWDETGGGLYLACYDRDYHLTEITFSSGEESAVPGERPPGVLPPPAMGAAYKHAETPGTHVNLGFDKRLLIPRRGGEVEVPEVVLGVHEGDWRWGADRYREWAESWMTETIQIPDWWRDAEGWTDSHLIHLGAYVDLAKGYARSGRKVRMDDSPYPMIAMWCQAASAESFAGFWPLHRYLGTPEQFRDGVQKHHERGNRFCSYILPCGMTPVIHQGAPRIGIVPRELFPDDELPAEGLYAEVGVRRYDGTLDSPDGLYAEGNACLGATRWQEYLTHMILNKYVREYGNDGMYLDGAGLYDMHTQDCKHLGHGHSGYGQWTQNFLEWLAALREETRRTRPGAIYTGEGMGDVYQMYLDGALFYPDNAPEVFRYTIPWGLGIILGVGFPDPEMAVWPEGMMEFCAVWGLKFGGVFVNLDQDPEKSAEILEFRRRFSQVQFRGRFVNEDGLTLSDPSLHAKLYLREDAANRALLLVAFNPEGSAGARARVDRSYLTRLQAAWVLPLGGDWQPLEVQQDREGFGFTLPDRPLSAVLLVDRCEPLILVDRPRPVVPGERGEARVTVTNLEARALSGQVSLRLPEGWSGEEQPFRLQSGESGIFTLGFTVPEGTPYDVHDIYGVTREGNRVTDKCVPMGVCRPVQAELYWIATDTLRLEMRNSSGREVSGTVEFSFPAGVTLEPAQTPFSLGPRGEGELFFNVAGVNSLEDREFLRATLRYGGDVTVAHEIAQPPVLNGGFERSSASDGWPDYWNYRLPATRYQRGATLDTEDFVEGRQSFRLDPNPHETTNLVATTLMRLVPDTRYRFSLAIKRSAHGAIGARLFTFGAKDPARAVSVDLGAKREGPVGVWERFEAEFLSADIDVPYEIIVWNNTRGEATVWFDDVRIEEVR